MNDGVLSLGWLGTGRMGAALAGRLVLRDEDFLSLYDQQARGAGLNPKAREE